MTAVAASSENVWKDDKLGYAQIGQAFTNLVQSIEGEKVISIEAGFGRGKTFFRTAWEKQLKEAGEVVVSVDLRQSDHSGDPVITLLGALLESLPKGEKSSGQKALELTKRIGVVASRSLTRAVLREGAEEMIEAISEAAIDKLEDFDALDGLIKEVGSEISKVAGQLITSQMAAEKVRKVELPAQLEALRSALVDGAQNNRVVIIIDELDRCHPEYAISFLEATKLISSQSGFVFCLMVNANYLENLARHRFGDAPEDEKYLDKFVDIRLKLEPKPEVFKSAVYELASKLPLKIPFGEKEAFSVESAARLASELAFECGFSLRKTKRILLKVEIALRCYSDRPLDLPLLVFMAFRDEKPEVVKEAYLKRSFLTPEEASKHTGDGLRSLGSIRDEERRNNQLNSIVYDKAPELLDLPKDRYLNPRNVNYLPWAWAFIGLAPHYIPNHREVLDGVAAVLIE